MPKIPKTLADLILLCDTNKDKPICRKIKKPLLELQKLIGMTVIKQTIVRQVVFIFVSLEIFFKKKKSTRLLKRKQINGNDDDDDIKPAKKKRAQPLYRNRAINVNGFEDDDDDKNGSAKFDFMAFLQNTDDEDDDDDDDSSDSAPEINRAKIKKKTAAEIKKEHEFSCVMKKRSLLGNQFMHLLIQGAPGTGKTTIAHIVYNIWEAIGLVAKNKLFLVTKADLVAGYLGQSTKKTRALIEKAAGGVVCIDEAYSLVSSNDGDSFGFEVLTEIVNSMSNPGDSAIFFFCGYKSAIEKNLFKANSGLKRRFGSVFTLITPNALEMFKIFKYQLAQEGWKTHLKNEKEFELFFKQNHQLFLTAAGGITFSLCKLAIEESVLSQFPRIKKKVVVYADVKNALEILKKQNVVTVEKPKLDMYM